MAKKPAALVVLTLALALGACATPTPYQPKAPGQTTSGGYSDVRIEPDRWRVTFAGNSLTSRETVEAYLLYRAAELTVQQGYDWFSTVDRTTQRYSHAYAEPTFYHPWYGYGWWPTWRYYGRGYRGWRTWDPYWGDPFWADSIDIRTVDKYEATTEILMHHGAKPEGDPRAFDARAVIENLRPRIRYPEPAK